MSIFYPTRRISHVSAITEEMLREMGITTLVLDVDNTLAPHDDPRPDPRAGEWLDKMRVTDIKLVLLSNNKERRVRPIALSLGLDYTSFAMKPLAKGFRETARRLGVGTQEMAVVGDQVFTDIVGANLYGCKSFLVEPLSREEVWSVRLKRGLERAVLKGYRER